MTPQNLARLAGITLTEGLDPSMDIITEDAAPEWAQELLDACRGLMQPHASFREFYAKMTAAVAKADSSAGLAI